VASVFGTDTVAIEAEVVTTCSGTAVSVVSAKVAGVDSVFDTDTAATSSSGLDIVATAESDSGSARTGHTHTNKRTRTRAHTNI